jgi:hypothetical protein
MFKKIGILFLLIHLTACAGLGAGILSSRITGFQENKNNIE